MSRRSSPPSISPTLWVAAGAAAGILVGIAIADRSTSARRILRQAGALLPALTGLLQIVGRQGAEQAEVAHDDDWADDLGDDGDDGDDGEPLDDDGEPLDERVLAAFDADPLLATLPIEIDSPAPGTIALDGVVPSARLIAHAVTIARGTPGVERVEHQLQVRRSRRPGA